MGINNFYKSYLSIATPHKHQIKMWEMIKKNKYPIFLKASTGSGKTEAVIAPFLAQFVKDKFSIAPRLIYVLPMRVLVNSIADRIKRYAHRVSRNVSVELQHGESPNDPFFIADVVVTTLDQFIYAYARVSNQVGHHLDIPAGAIASSLVVFDEAHMYRDGFTFSMMRAMFEILDTANIPFVVMTATMPESLEESLFEKINVEENQKIVSAGFSLNNQINIFIEKEPVYKDNEINISNTLLERIKNRKTLIILNQVKRAQEIYKEIKKRLELKENREIVLLHSRFTRKDRKEHEETSLRMLLHKKDGKIIIPEGTGVVISTQVLEAGIDFSAELLLTELSPADSLVQRAGRCARYEDEQGEMVVFPVGNEKGYLPYEKNHLKKTIKWLEENKNFDIRNFSAASRFVNVLNYKADDYAARDSLIDFYECVLYADAAPMNIQVRNSKPVTLIVLDSSLGINKAKKRQNKKDIAMNAIMKAIKDSKSYIKDNSINVDIGVVWYLFKKEERLIRWEFLWKYNKDKKRYEIDIRDLLGNNKNVSEEDRRIGPFRTYIIESTYYDSLQGVVPDESPFI
ncbi:MAG: CRISPR-associated helicase Cas3' [Candidatus Aerophobetes bacterium]|nr:CRISPR-associated helicase Cas3' [Candidatus Aerophobetes bacterium]